jgi:hypothetical protein
VKSNSAPGKTQLATRPKVAPKPYSNTIVGAKPVPPPSRHCLPSKLTANPLRATPLQFLNAAAIQPAMAPEVGLPK